MRLIVDEERRSVGGTRTIFYPEADVCWCDDDRLFFCETVLPEFEVEVLSVAPYI